MTSPPFWGLRDYGIEGQMGLEATFQEYVDSLVKVCIEIRRVLAKDGSFYLNLGDTYSSMLGRHGNETAGFSKSTMVMDDKKPPRPQNLPQKCLVGIPWRVALRLIDEQWILRNDIIWHKPNVMPSSVKDRLTNTYEHIFHFVKSRKYYYDLDAIREPHKTKQGPFNIRVRDAQKGRLKAKWGNKYSASENEIDRYDEKSYTTKHDFAVRRPSNSSYHDPLHLKAYHPKGRNPGDIISIKERMGDAHKGEATANLYRPHVTHHPSGKNPGDVVYPSFPPQKGWIDRTRSGGFRQNPSSVDPRGKNPGDFWQITTKPHPFAHFAVYPEEICVRPILSSSRIGDVVLDPFIGSGTTGVVAKKLGRNFIGIDIKQEYVEIARKRIAGAEELVRSPVE